MPYPTIDHAVFDDPDPYLREDLTATATAATAWTEEHAAPAMSTANTKEMMDMYESATTTKYPPTSPAHDPSARESAAGWDADASSPSTSEPKEHGAGEKVATVIDTMKDRFDDFVGGIKDGLGDNDDKSQGHVHDATDHDVASHDATIETYDDDDMLYDAMGTTTDAMDTTTDAMGTTTDADAGTATDADSGAATEDTLVYNMLADDHDATSGAHGMGDNDHGDAQGWERAEAERRVADLNHDIRHSFEGELVA